MDVGCTPEEIREIEVDLEKLAKYTIGNLGDRNLWRIFNTIINAHGKSVKLRDIPLGEIRNMPVVARMIEKRPDLPPDAIVSIISNARDRCLIAKGIPLATVGSESDTEKLWHARHLLNALLGSEHASDTTPSSRESPPQT